MGILEVMTDVEKNYVAAIIMIARKRNETPEKVYQEHIAVFFYTRALAVKAEDMAEYASQKTMVDIHCEVNNQIFIAFKEMQEVNKYAKVFYYDYPRFVVPWECGKRQMQALNDISSAYDWLKCSEDIKKCLRVC